jgi:prophage maintenance system killer protein
VSQAQAFVVGNRRTAFHATAMFLLLNGVDVTRLDALELASQLEAVAERTDRLENATARFEVWLRTALEAG